MQQAGQLSLTGEAVAAAPWGLEPRAPIAHGNCLRQIPSCGNYAAKMPKPCSAREDICF